jgi:ubiquinone/menaquinone biosynthesis C-methylase UbiE
MKMVTSKRMPNFAFRIMSLIHDNQLQWIFKKPYRLLRAAGLKQGQKILEVGCGPGFFTIPASKIVGEKGVVYALDNHPLAIKRINEKVKKEGIDNIKTILADATKTGLPDESIDVAFLFGFVHHIKGMDDILSELYRVLKPDATLSIEKTPWLSKEKLITAVERNKFIYLGHQGRAFLFSKESGEESSEADKI